MKKTLLFLLIWTVFNALMGQSTGILYKIPSPASGIESIVKYVPSMNQHIIYAVKYSSTMENHFLLTDMVNVVDAHVSDNYIISDFEVIDNYVVFCGRYYYSGGSTGIIGWFDIDSLFNYGVPVHIDQSLYTLGLESLDNIEVFRDVSGQVHVAGYGSYILPIGYYKYRIFEAIGNLPGYMWSRAADFCSFFSPRLSEVVDMTVTDNYVVFLEHDKSDPADVSYGPYGVGISLYPLPKYNMLSTTTIPDFFFQTVTYNNFPDHIVPDYQDPVTKPKIAYSGEEKVAVCSYRRDMDPGSMGHTLNQWYLVHRVYDLNPYLSSGSPIVMTSAAMAPLPDDVGLFNGFEYDPVKKKYITLNRHTVSIGVNETAVTTIDFSSGSAPTFIMSDYQAAYNTNSYWLPNSICLDGASNYTVSGCNSPSYEPVLWQNIVNLSEGRCDRKVLYAMQSLETMPFKEEYCNAEVQGWNRLVYGERPEVVLLHFTCIELCNPNN